MQLGNQPCIGRVIAKITQLEKERYIDAVIGQDGKNPVISFPTTDHKFIVLFHMVYPMDLGDIL